ncbi:21861_t:CDS:1, partial [Gigaspora margarita]
TKRKKVHKVQNPETNKIRQEMDLIQNLDAKKRYGLDNLKRKRELSVVDSFLSYNVAKNILSLPT